MILGVLTLQSITLLTLSHFALLRPIQLDVHHVVHLTFCHGEAPELMNGRKAWVPLQNFSAWDSLGPSTCLKPLKN